LRRFLSDHAAWSRRADVFLVLLAVLGILLHLLSESTRHLKEQPHLDEKIAAATRVESCFQAIREVRMGTPASMDPENDPEASGLIGQEFTPTTTDRGILEAKLTSVNPNFAALFVQYYHDMDLEEGDAVAIGTTGSFPALNIAAIVSAEELNLRPIVIASVGASMWGANDPEFTWLDMESLLNARHLIQTRTVAASYGGSNDRGRGLSPDGRAKLRAAIVRNGVPPLTRPTLDESIDARIEIFDREAGADGIRAYVNIGGGAASIGTSLNGNLIPAGINETLKPYNWTQRGALHRFARRGLPILHILRVQSIALDYGFPVAPETVPSVGEGNIFFREVYDLRIAIPAFLIYALLCFGVLRSRHRAASAARELVIPAVTSPQA